MQKTVIDYVEIHKEDVQQCQTYKDKVFLLMEHFTFVRDDDYSLLNQYAKYFENPKYAEDTIKRYARHWRQMNHFKISAAAKVRRRKQAQEHREYWAGEIKD